MHTATQNAAAARDPALEAAIPSATARASLLDRFFQLRQHGTTASTERSLRSLWRW